MIIHLVDIYYIYIIYIYIFIIVFIIFRYIQHQEAASAFFPLRHILLQCSLARIASPALQSTWQECHFFHKGSVMLTQRLLNLLLALINALLLQLLATCLSLYLSGHQVSCSNAASFQPALLDRESSNWLGHVGLCLYDQRSGPSSATMTNMIWHEGPYSCTSLRRSCVRRFGTMPVFVKTAVTDMHRCDSCVMWQACAGYWKHLENRSVSSLHWK